MFFNYLLEKRSTNNVSEVTIQLIKQLRIPVTATLVIDTVERHPDFPSLLSISDSLAQWKVENVALKVDSDQLEALPIPFIAHLKKGRGNFVLVQSINGDITYLDAKGKAKKQTKEAFIEEWDNIVLLAEKSQQSGDRNFRVNRKNEIADKIRMPFLILGALILILLYKFSGPEIGLSIILLLLVKLSGMIVSGLLLWFEVDKSNPMLKQICSGGKKTNCTAILGSKRSKLFAFISWSEIGFFYFTGGFLFILSSVYSPDAAFGLIRWMNLLALPYTIFSVYYQWRVAKQWCPLCLTVQGLLIAEFLIGYISFWQATLFIKPVIDQPIVFFVSFLLPIFFWVSTKKVYAEAQFATHHRKEAARTKYNKEVFEALLLRQKSLTGIPDRLGILLGASNARHRLIKVCNPYCGPCAKAHPVIDELLEQHDDLNVQIIFFTGVGENRDKRIDEPVKHMMALYEKNDPELMRKALDDWYHSDKKDYTVFTEKYPLQRELQIQEKKLEAMNQWCILSGIAYTPTFFINGYQLPEAYKIEDLKYFL